MTKTVLFIAAFAAALAAAPIASAHRQWIAPSATVLSGAEGYVGFDAAISNTLFHPDHNPMRLDNLKIYGPNGAEVAPENVSRSKFRSTFDLHLTQAGTYRVVNAMQGVNARYTLNGENQMWRGTAGEFATAIPTGAADVRVSETANRVETFVTLGAPTPIMPTNVGLELVPVTHPNDVVAGEEAHFRFIFDGAPAASLEVTLAPGNARYRDQTGEIKVRTGADGAFAVTLPEAGLWWINAAVRDLPSQIQGATRGASYSGVFEALP